MRYEIASSTINTLMMIHDDPAVTEQFQLHLIFWLSSSLSCGLSKLTKVNN